MTDSWWLKFKRAQRHMVELRRMARLYAKANPYEIVRVSQPKRKDNRWRYRLALRPPDPMLVAVLGDFVHNLRSALDHVVVACSPPADRNNASFPVTHRDLWAKDANGEFLDRDAEGREDFDRAIRGLSDTAKACVKLAQPYQGDSPVSHVIGMLNRLENADKHRGTINLGIALQGGSVAVYSRGVLKAEFRGRPDQFLKNGAEIISFEVPNPSIKESQVKVEAGGTPTIHIQLVEPDSRPENVLEFSLCDFMLVALHNVRFLLRVLERFAR
jgi:hypothetical protein